MSRPLIVGTRGSKLALTQAEQVAAALRTHHPDRTIELRIISTKGDRVLDVALSQVGDKGLFVKEIEVALLTGEIDVAVHSCKDLPSEIMAGLTLGAFPARVDPRDALVLPAGQPTVPGSTDALALLPQGAIVGTSSLRRASQLRALRPDLALRDVRGNVDTRLRKLDSGEYHALILASAGLDRLGLTERISLRLDSDVLLPAVAQGALAIEARADDAETLRLLAVLDDPTTRAAVLAERAFLRRLEGGCQVPIAGYAEVDQAAGRMRLRGLVAMLDGSATVRGERTSGLADPAGTGLALAEELLEQGAAALLAAQATTEAHQAAGDGGASALPLQGWRVVVTRAAEQADGLTEHLRRLGAEPIAYPVIAFAPPADPQPFNAALTRLLAGGYDWLVLTSVTAVRIVAAGLAGLQAVQQGNGTGTLPPTLQIAAVGSATADACAEMLGKQPAVVPEKFVAEALAEALRDMHGKRVLLPNADLARPVLQRHLEAAGAAVERVEAYRTVPATGGAEDLPAQLDAGQVHAITFTSGSTVRHFAERVGPAALERARAAVIACIGPVTADAAQQAGLAPTVVAETSTIEGLVAALVAWRQAQ